MVHFLCPHALGVWQAVDRFVATGLAEQTVTLYPSSTARKQCHARVLSTYP